MNFNTNHSLFIFDGLLGRYDTTCNVSKGEGMRLRREPFMTPDFGEVSASKSTSAIPPQSRPNTPLKSYHLDMSQVASSRSSGPQAGGNSQTIQSRYSSRMNIDVGLKPYQITLISLFSYV
jgi:hypothetical protein